jgi:tRNA threonylcarbamoyl adenosine modification protein (Sua5/YciO/YrdC/YwlC family)
MTAHRVPVPDGVDRGLVRKAVEAIRAGQVVVLPTETVYGLVADPRSPASVDRIREVKQRPEGLVFTHHVADRDAIDTLVPPPPARVVRLLDRYWPGPLTIVLPDGRHGTLGFRLPAHEFTRAVIREFAPSLYMTSVNRSGQPPIVAPSDIAREFADDIDLIFDAGVPPLEQASTVVRWQDGELEVLREGVLTAAEVFRTAARNVLFICTGNTCRSPLAVALARRAAAAELGVSEERVLAHGLDFGSAGAAAGDGFPASGNSIAVAAEIGLDLREHRTRQLDRELLTAADHVYCLGPSHLVAAQSLAPEHADRIELLDPDGGAIPDPFGGDLETYRRTREVIGRAVERRVRALLASD